MVFQGDQYIGQPLWFPRRPLVSVPDLTLALAVLWMMSTADGLTRLYFLVAFVQFAVSGIHHWLPEARWHRIADRCTIFWLISMTPAPYYDSIASSWWPGFAGCFWLSIIASIIGTVWLTREAVVHDRMVSTDCYIVPFGFGAASLLGVALPDAASYTALWIGVILYAFNGVVIKRYWPTVATARVVQHMAFLYPWFGLHAYILLTNI